MLDQDSRSALTRTLRGTWGLPDTDARRMLAPQAYCRRLLPVGETRAFTMVSRSVPKFDHRPKAPSLFLVPMRLFVEQQAAAVRGWTSREVGGHVGGKPEALPPAGREPWCAGIHAGGVLRPGAQAPR
jgi:hypothetical protein